MFDSLIAVLAPVFITAALGFGWVKSGQVLDPKPLTPVIVFIGSPCLVYSTLLNSGVTIEALAEMITVSAIAHGTALALGAGCLLIMGLPRRVFLPSLFLPNTGNMGLPLCLFAFGEIGLALGIAYFTVSAVLQFTAGVAIAAGGMTLGRLVRTPHIYAVLLAVFMIYFDVEQPVWLTNTVTLVGQFTIPLMLLFLGVSLATLKVGGVGRAFVLALVRIGGGLAVGLALVWAFGLTGTAAGVVIIQASMPVAVFNYLFAQYYDNQPSEVAALVVVSTVISFALLPILMPFVL